MNCTRALATLWLCAITSTALNGCASEPASSTSTARPTNEAPIALVADKGEVLGFVFSRDRPGADEIRQQYFDGMSALAMPLGLRGLGRFDLPTALFGRHEASILNLLALPSPEAAAALHASADYQALSPKLAQGWTAMDVIEVELQEDLALSIFPDRFYSVAKVWVSDADTHEAYVAAAGPTRAELGISILAAFKPSKFRSLEPDRVAPYKVVLVEWPHRSVIEQYQQSPALEAIRQTDGTAIADIEWYEVQ